MPFGKAKRRSRKVPVESVPFVQGFKLPSKKESDEAIGFATEKIPKIFNPEDSDDGFKFFNSIPTPVCIDDWLAQYNERGQTYQCYVEQCSWLSTRKRKYMSQDFVPSGQTIKQKYPDGKIYIVQVGEFDEDASSLFSRLIEYTSIFLGLPVVALPSLKLEVSDGKVYWVIEQTEQSANSEGKGKFPLESRYNEETKHIQVCVSSNLMQLRETIPDDALCLIGLTMMDLYCEPSDLFVAGIAGSQRVAIFSLYRYDPRLTFCTEFWYKIKKRKSMSKKRCQHLILQRGCKLLVHEIGHLLGIGHCIFFDCCMNGSGHLEEDFRQPMHLCPVDLHKLHTLVGFDINTRYSDLLKFYNKEGFKEESEWMDRRLKYLSG